MNEFQYKLYEIIKKVDAFCQSHGIEYYLGGGSALGAIRHKGFLPWDDDVDLYITRKNYHKLLATYEEFETMGLAFVDGNIYENYSNSLVRIVEKETTMIAQHRIIDGTPKGFFVEFFVMDPIPKNDEKKALWMKKYWVYATLRAIKFKAANLKWRNYLDQDLFNEYMEKYETNPKKTMENLTQEIFCIEEDDSEEYILRWGININTFRIEWFGSPKYVPFENILLPVGQSQEEILRADYGDSWMMIPDEDAQIVHDSVICNLDIPYEIYVNDYEKFIKNDELTESYIPRKKFFLNELFASIQLLEKSYDFYAILIQKKLEKLKVSEALLQSYADFKQYHQIESMMHDWYKIQFSKIFLSGKEYLAIEDGKLYYALIPMLLRGEYSKVRKILTWKEKKSKNKGQVKELAQYVENIRNAYISLDHEDWDRIYYYTEKAEEHFYLYKEQFDYVYLRLLAEEKQIDDNAKLKQLLESAKELLVNYPNMYQIHSIIGDIYYKLKDFSKAKEHYVVAKTKSRNGMLIMYINQILEKLAGESSEKE